MSGLVGQPAHADDCEAYQARHRCLVQKVIHDVPRHTHAVLQTTIIIYICKMYDFFESGFSHKSFNLLLVHSYNQVDGFNKNANKVRAHTASTDDTTVDIRLW